MMSVLQTSSSALVQPTLHFNLFTLIKAFLVAFLAQPVRVVRLVRVPATDLRWLPLFDFFALLGWARWLLDYWFFDGLGFGFGLALGGNWSLRAACLNLTWLIDLLGLLLSSLLQLATWLLNLSFGSYFWNGLRGITNRRGVLHLARLQLRLAAREQAHVVEQVLRCWKLWA